MCFICPRGDSGGRAGVCRATGALLGVPLHLRRMSRPAQSTAREPASPARGDLQAGAPPDRPTAPTGSLGSHDLSTTKASLNYEPRQGGSTERKPTHTHYQAVFQNATLQKTALSYTTCSSGSGEFRCHLGGRSSQWLNKKK